MAVAEQSAGSRADLKVAQQNAALGDASLPRPHVPEDGCLVLGGRSQHGAAVREGHKPHLIRVIHQYLHEVHNIEPSFLNCHSSWYEALVSKG